MEFVQSVVNRGLSLLQRGQFDSADVLFETLQSEAAVRPVVQHARGLIALQRGEDERAMELIAEAIELNPQDAEAHGNLGFLLLKVGQYPQALAAYASALTLRPDNPVAHFGLGRALAALELNGFAEDAFRDALGQAPDMVEVVAELAKLLNVTGRQDEAVALLRDAIGRHPESAELHMVLAASLLALGEWPAAWAEYEWHLADPEFAKSRLSTDRPRWQGEVLGGKTILLHGERDIGDILQFARYASLVKARGGRVILRVPQPLVPLLQSLDAASGVVGAEEALPAFDVHAPLVSLPLIFATQTETVPAKSPYLEPDPRLVTQWRERLGQYPGISIGLVWQDGLDAGDDSRRSLHLDWLKPLLDCPNGRFVSLQVGAGREQLIGLDPHILDAGALLEPASLVDMAAIIANLDLVIAVDGTVAHLAGALGKPVWLLLSTAADARWMKDREYTPWYPTARLFRQSRPSGWDDVVERVRAALWSHVGVDEEPAAERGADPIVAATVLLTANPHWADPLVCDGLFVEACRQYRAKNVERARKLFEHVLSLDSVHVNTLCNLGALELEHGSGPRALTLLQTAVTLAPELAPARTAYANALLAAGRHEKALEEHRKAVELAPQSASVHVAYATALRNLGRAGAPAGLDIHAVSPLVEKHFRKALELAPADDTVHAGYAMALVDAGRLDGAMAHFLAATKINQHQPPEFYEALGRTCLARGNAQGAEVSLNHAIALDPRRASAHCALGELYLAVRRPRDAAVSFRNVLAIEATNGAALSGIERAKAASEGASLTKMP